MTTGLQKTTDKSPETPAKSAIANQKKVKDGKKDTDIYVGVSLELNKQTIVLAPKTPINQYKTQGLELELPDNVFLGNVGDAMDAIIAELQPGASSEKVKVANITKTCNEIPVLKGVVNKLTKADLTLGKFHIKLYPEAQNKKPDYTVAMLATWRDEEDAQQPQAGGFSFKIKGLFVMLTNELEPKDVNQMKSIEEAAAQVQKYFTIHKPVSALAPATEDTEDNAGLGAATASTETPSNQPVRE